MRSNIIRFGIHLLGVVDVVYKVKDMNLPGTKLRFKTRLGSELIHTNNTLSLCFYFYVYGTVDWDISVDQALCTHLLRLYTTG